MHEQTSYLRNTGNLRKPARLENYVLVAEHAEPNTWQDAMLYENFHMAVCYGGRNGFTEERNMRPGSTFTRKDSH